MNSPKKHKPLSPEELFEWLDKKSDNEKSMSSFSNADFDNLDEFEKDAIEGFESYSSPDKAKALMDEINLEISKKIVAKEPAKKNRIIWFSAAASLLLIVSLSVFLINKTQEETESNIALNDLAPKDTGKDEPAKEEEMKVLETPANDIKEAGKGAKPEIVTETGEQRPLGKLAEENLESQKIRASEAANTGVANGVIVTILSQNQVDVAKNKDLTNANVGVKADEDVVSAFDSKAVMPVAQDNETSKKKTKEEDKTVNDEMTAVSANENLSQAETVVMNEKSNREVKFKERKVAQKAAVTKSADTSPMYLQNATTTSVPSGYVADGVYKTTRYEGGESAIKSYVLDYLKTKFITQTMKGSFKVNGTVNEKGILSIESLTSVNDECKDCEAVLKNALNTMPNWQPAMQSGKAVSAKTSFVLKF